MDENKDHGDDNSFGDMGLDYLENEFNRQREEESDGGD
jgi:hypothetical protein